MIVGNADLAELSIGAATIDAWQSGDLTFAGVECFQLTAEMRNVAREPLLPAGLHPTIPPCLSLQVWNVSDGPWGAFSLAFTRVTCRSGVRARGFTTRAVVSTGPALDGLRSHFGFPAQLGQVSLRRHYDGLDAHVAIDGATVLSVAGLDPDPMGISDVQYTGTLNLAHTPNGLRLVQVEADHVPTRVERLTSRITSFDGAAWGNALLDPYFVVSSSVALEDITMPSVRFVCRPDELAFTGTEKVG